MLRFQAADHLATHLQQLEKRHTETTASLKQVCAQCTVSVRYSSLTAAKSQEIALQRGIVNQLVAITERQQTQIEALQQIMAQPGFGGAVAPGAFQQPHSYQSFNRQDITLPADHAVQVCASFELPIYFL